jgi:mediator of RNA polymerase II transcription subunit 12, fungi type
MVDFLREKGDIAPALDPETQNIFLPAICTRLEKVEAILDGRSSEISTIAERSAFTPCVVFLARLLQFNLGFSGVWTATTKEIIPRLSGTVLSLLLVSFFCTC